MISIFCFLAVFCVFLWTASQLEPDPDPPNIYPDGYNYGVFWDRYTDHFKRQTGDNTVIAWVQFGLVPDGIDRDGTDPTDLDDLGKPTYDDEFDFFSEDAMEFISAMCEDMQSGDRYGDKDERMVYGT
eukprot:UN02639